MLALDLRLPYTRNGTPEFKLWEAKFRKPPGFWRKLGVCVKSDPFQQVKFLKINALWAGL